MDFITYINKQGVFKTVECEYDSADNSIITIDPINENYLVTSIFVDSKKRKVKNAFRISSVQLAVINDDNFDGNLLDENHYSIEGTRFYVQLLPLDSVGVGSASSDVNVKSSIPLTVLRHDVDVKGNVSLKYRPKLPIFNPMFVGAFNQDSENVIYFDVFINRDFNTVNQYQKFYRVYDPVGGVCVPNVAIDILSNKNGSYLVHELIFRIYPFSGYTFANGELSVVRVYYDVVNNVYSVASSSGSFFNPLGALVYAYNDGVSTPSSTIINRLSDIKKINFSQMTS
jgi:hypothetical protein